MEIDLNIFNGWMHDLLIYTVLLVLFFSVLRNTFRSTIFVQADSSSTSSGWTFKYFPVLHNYPYVVVVIV